MGVNRVGGLVTMLWGCGEFMFSGILATIDLDSILESSQRAKEALSGIWNYLGNSLLYSQLISLGRSLMLVAIIFYAYQLYRKVLDDLDYRPLIPAIITPLILIFLLGNPSLPQESPIWRLSVQLRNVIYAVDKKIMEGLVRDANLSEEIKRTQITNYIRTVADEVINECMEIADVEARYTCLTQRAAPALQNLYQLQQQRVGNNPAANKGWFERILGVLNLNGGDNNQRNPGDILGWALRGLADALVDALGLVITVCSIVVNYIIEAGFVLVSIVAPIAIGLSLFPIPSKPVYLWLMGYLGIGLWKISTNVLAGLGCYVMNRGDDLPGFNYIVFAVLVGLFAPLIGGVLASFSAMNISQGILNSGVQGFKGGANIAGKAAGVAGGATKLAVGAALTASRAAMTMVRAVTKAIKK